MENKVILELPLGYEVVMRKINKDYEKKCSLCGKYRGEIKKLIVGMEASICNECIELSYKILIDEKIVTIKE